MAYVQTNPLGTWHGFTLMPTLYRCVVCGEQGYHATATQPTCRRCQSLTQEARREPYPDDEEAK